MDERASMRLHCLCNCVSQTQSEMQRPKRQMPKVSASPLVVALDCLRPMLHRAHFDMKGALLHKAGEGFMS
jgi:hypothetical protein